ncbi:unknown [Firmicutes bacterium CAG:884]|nr:MepB family protein [Bacillota bacterium]CCY93994.1 unknown [Firmicutes bacterium CAG:884]
MNKKILYLLFISFVLITTYEVMDAYGLFESKNKLVVNQNVARWKILINGSNITEEDFVINSINVEGNENVLNGKLAPGVRGYFDVEIDPKADTSIVYSISFDFSQISDSFIVENIEETTSGNLIRTDESTYSKVITLNEIKENKKNNVRVYLKWENKEDNNATDSKIGLTENNYINIPVSVSAMQYFGEDIEEYQENGQ